MLQKVRRAAITAGVLGFIVAAACAAALYVAGNVIDEQRIDAGFLLLPLFAGVAIGTLVAIAGVGTWTIGYAPATRGSHHE